MTTETSSFHPNVIDQAELLRLQALRLSDLLDTPPEEAFDRLTRFAAQVLRVPVALVSLIDQDRQFFKSQQGLKEPFASQRQTPLSHSFCKHVVESGDPLVVTDARLHPTLCKNPAIEELGVVAYAGMPLLDAQGFSLGSLCAIDARPRQWTTEELELLHGIAAQVMTEIQLRNKLQQAHSDVATARQLEADRKSMARLTVHDLRTPLSSLLLSMEMLSLLGPLNAAQKNALSLCNRTAQMLRSIVDDLLDIEAIGQDGASILKFEHCHPIVLANRAADQVLPLATASAITLERDFAPGLLAFRGDEQKLERVLVNLLANAVKFTPRRGCIRLSVRVELRDIPELHFIIQDSGIGMRSEDTQHIFKEGVRLNRNANTRSSTGLGLTFCKRIIEAHGGKITIETAPGQGSTFTVILPVSNPTAPASKRTF